VLSACRFLLELVRIAEGVSPLSLNVGVTRSCFPPQWYELLPDSVIQTTIIPKLNFVSRLLVSKLFISIKTDLREFSPRCLSRLSPFQPMYFQYSQSGIVRVFRVSHRNSTTSLLVEILLPPMMFLPETGNTQTGLSWGVCDDNSCEQALSTQDLAEWKANLSPRRHRLTRECT